MSAMLMSCRLTDSRLAVASALGKISQKTNDLAREAVGCNGVFGVPVSVVLICRPHAPTTPA